MARTAPQNTCTWRWIWHGKIPSNGWQGGIRFRMAGAKGWSYRHLIGRTRYGPRGLRPCAAKCTITGGAKKPDCVEITLDMSDDAKKQAHANIDRIPSILRLTRQRGRWTEDGAEYSHPRLLCLIFLDGPRGYPAPPGTTYHDMFEDMNPLFGFDEVPEGLFHEFGVGVSKSGYQWHAWLGWKGVQKGWYQISKDWPPTPAFENSREAG